MPKHPRWEAKDAEKQLLAYGFDLIRTKGSHRIYYKNNVRVVIPFHSGRILHPKIIKQVLKATEQ
ncbi:MAG: type II toxin-antitoxin system HicA family toxin [Melioribacteraceae bacterium]|nr:type II toxin-antitoxin system HicA family toxin [Melioribacteraceae bacterium]